MSESKETGLIFGFSNKQIKRFNTETVNRDGNISEIKVKWTHTHTLKLYFYSEE